MRRVVPDRSLSQRGALPEPVGAFLAERTPPARAIDGRESPSRTFSTSILLLRVQVGSEPAGECNEVDHTGPIIAVHVEIPQVAGLPGPVADRAEEPSE